MSNYGGSFFVPRTASEPSESLPSRACFPTAGSRFARELTTVSDL